LQAGSTNVKFTGTESEQIKVSNAIIEGLKKQQEELSSQLKGQELYNQLNRDQLKILEDIADVRINSAKEIKALQNVEIEDISGLVDSQIESDMKYFSEKEKVLKSDLSVQQQIKDFELTAFENAEKRKEEIAKNSLQERFKAESEYLQRILVSSHLKAENEIELEQAKVLAIDNIRQQSFELGNSLISLAETTGLISAKKAFQLNQGLAIADATINTYKSVTAALAQPLPPPFPQIDAGLRLAAGVAQIAKIASTKFNGGKGSGSLSGGGSSGSQGFSSSTRDSRLSNTVNSSISQTGQGSVFVVRNTFDERGISTVVDRGAIARRQVETSMTSD